MENNKTAPDFKKESFPGCLKPGFKPFDPIALARATEKVVCRGNKRLYSRFSSTINYQKGIATGYAVGCCLRCIYCWSSETRDCLVKTSSFFSPQEVFEKLEDIAKRKHLDQVRVSDAEATIGRMHLLQLLELVERSTIKRFILETNGILLGYDRSYVRSLSQFRKVRVRLSLKAGTADGFTSKTGAVPESFELPFQAIRNLRAEGIKFWVAAMSADPQFMTPLERVSLIGKLAEIDPALVLNLEEEMVVLFPETLKRLKASGWDFSSKQLSAFQKIPGLRRFLQISYQPISSLAARKISRGFTVKAIRELFHGI